MPPNLNFPENTLGSSVVAQVPGFLPPNWEGFQLSLWFCPKLSQQAFEESPSRQKHLLSFSLSLCICVFACVCVFSPSPFPSIINKQKFFKIFTWRKRYLVQTYYLRIYLNPLYFTLNHSYNSYKS